MAANSELLSVEYLAAGCGSFLVYIYFFNFFIFYFLFFGGKFEEHISDFAGTVWEN